MNIEKILLKLVLVAILVCEATGQPGRGWPARTPPPFGNASNNRPDVEQFKVFRP